MINKYIDLANYAFNYAQEKEIEYVEVRLESNVRDTIAFINGNLHIGNLPIDLSEDAFTRKRGINIRTIADCGLGMSSTNTLSQQSLKDTVDQAYKNAKRKLQWKISN